MAQVESIPPAGQSAHALFDEVYQRLKAMAGRERARRNGSPTLCTTELVHELYLRMGRGEEKRFDDPIKFFAYAARAMRSILTDAARSRSQVKSGGDLVRVPITDPSVGEVKSVEVDVLQALHLDTALKALELEDARAARVVELHYFAGLSIAQVADLLGVNSRTVDRDWRYARAFLSVLTGP